MNRYQAFMKIIETGSFTKAAEELGYTQSAISQMVRSLEEELSTILFLRSRKGISLTPDAEEFLPYIKGVHNSLRELAEKHREMQGLQTGIIRIGTFSSISSNWLPDLIRDFKARYPSVCFELHQGEYTSIAQLIKEGSVDFGFVNPDAQAVSELKTIPLQQDEMLVVVPKNHPLTLKKKTLLQDLVNEAFILLDEGQLSVPLEFFKRENLHPNVQYRVHDDYTIMSMIESGLGISILPKLIISRSPYRISTLELYPPIVRTISLAFKNKKVLPIASRYFMDFIVEQYGRIT
ncbi:LysR family transcriptional regulator [Desulfosporosinus meridiei]|uniref:Transcriptional regulator n=1 Tax=Desulfosporosinus meridiei (strain ATCC BAA-275 / DSM 13257 / KCTC 12902 / NCIMB 13706 / S10) TaxID=768704 RepID=J7IRI2_DESMD|nr:LysR family transcriptional regulator [Desulfosporosinus meridiei]AFQ44270.1 transcriptional regulator [Desulfosporosinus meridiei DSM 13257]